MKKLFALILIAFAFNASGQNNKNHPYRTIRTIITDLNHDNKSDTIVLISSLEQRNSFNRISISLSGGTKKTFKAKDYWTMVDSSFLVHNKNDYHTKLLFLKKTDVHTAILLFGELDGAGYRGEFSIINIENNNVKLVFDHGNDDIDVEIPATITNLEHDGRLYFIYSNYGELYDVAPKLNADIGTYHPYFVYKVDDVCKLDSLSTKTYNENHYVFAGFKYSEKIKVLYPRNGGRPRIWEK